MKEEIKTLLLVTTLSLVVGIALGIYIEKPISYNQGKLDQKAYDAGAYDAFALYWYNYSSGILDLRYYNYIPTEKELNTYFSHPYIQGWLYYNETKELRPNVVPMFGEANQLN